MIVLNLQLNGIYGFNNFNINFTYPKRLLIQLLKMNFWMDANAFAIKRLLF